MVCCRFACAYLGTHIMHAESCETKSIGFSEIKVVFVARCFAEIAKVPFPGCIPQQQWV